MKIHVFATMMALYPITKTEVIAEEFGISVAKLRRRKRRELRAVKLWNEGVSMGDIAKRLRISKDTVYKYLLNAKKKAIILKK